MSKNLSGDLLYEILRNYDANKLDDNYKRSNSNEYLIGKHLENMLEEKDSNNLKYYFMCGIIHELAPNNPVIVVQEIKQDEDKKEISRDESESQIYGEASIKEWMKTSKTDPMNREPILGLKSVQSGRSEKLLQCFEEYRKKLSDKEQKELDKAIDGILNKIMLFEAVKGNNIDKVRELVERKHADVNAKDDKGKTLLYIAVEKGHLEIARVLLYKDADVNAKDSKGMTPLNIATLKGFTEIVNILRVQKEKNKALLRASWGRDLDSVKKALESGANINTAHTPLDKWQLRWTEFNGWTALHFAVHRRDNSEVVKFLLEHGADINAISSDGKPFDVVTNKENAKLLIEAGAVNAENIDSYIRDAERKSSSYDLEFGYDSEIVDLLHEQKRKLAQDKALLKAIMKEDLKGVIKAIKLANVNTTDKYGDASLHMAVGQGNLKIVQLLLEVEGIDINRVNKYGDTPLHIAAYYGNSGVVTLLLGRGADVNVKNNEGKTPLDVAREESKTEIADIIRNQPSSNLSTKSVEAGQQRGRKNSV